jgi:hypothetical protein
MIFFRNILGGTISGSTTLSNTISAPDILDKYAAWLRALSDIRAIMPNQYLLIFNFGTL